MAKSQAPKVRSLPPWLTLSVSVVIAAHLSAVLILVLAAPSGPWPAPYGTDMSPGPFFAGTVNAVTARHYLHHLGMSHNYHFESNRMAQRGVYFEVKLKFKDGKTETLRFPEDNANFWVRHRQQLLARGLADDLPIQPRGPERVASKKQEVEKATYWLLPDEVLTLAKDNIVPAELAKVKEEPLAKKMHFILVSVPEDQDGAVRAAAVMRPMMARPSPMSLVLAKSFMRYLCRKYNAESAELIRHSREAIMPAYMFMQQEPPDSFTEMVAHYGQLDQD